MTTILDKNHLQQTLSKLSLIFAKKETGQGFLAYTETEPFFCIEKDTEEDLFEAIKEIIVFYSELHGVDLEGKIKFSPVREIREEKIKPIRRFGLDNDSREELGIA